VHALASDPPLSARVGSSSPPVCARWIPGDLVVHLMVGGPLVRARGIHAPSTATPSALCRPVLF
jgi:hypothetical protein